jgi:hypothetical protein
MTFPRICLPHIRQTEPVPSLREYYLNIYVSVFGAKKLIAENMAQIMRANSTPRGHATTMHLEAITMAAS